MHNRDMQVIKQLHQALVESVPRTVLEIDGHKYELVVFHTGWSKLLIDGKERLCGYKNLLSKRLREWQSKGITS